MRAPWVGGHEGNAAFTLNNTTHFKPTFALQQSQVLAQTCILVARLALKPQPTTLLHPNPCVVNFFHDKLYAVGFTEAHANFQINNYKLGGVGGDGVMAEVQDGDGTDNANFASSPGNYPYKLACRGPHDAKFR